MRDCLSNRFNSPLLRGIRSPSITYDYRPNISQLAYNRFIDIVLIISDNRHDTSYSLIKQQETGIKSNANNVSMKIGVK